MQDVWRTLVSGCCGFPEHFSNICAQAKGGSSQGDAAEDQGGQHRKAAIKSRKVGSLSEWQEELSQASFA